MQLHFYLRIFKTLSTIKLQIFSNLISYLIHLMLNSEFNLIVARELNATPLTWQNLTLY